MTLSLETSTPDSIDNFLNTLSGNAFATATVKAYQSDLKMFLQERSLQKISLESFPSQVQLWLNESRKTLAARTVERRLTSMRAYWKWATKGTSNLLPDYRLPTALIPEPHPLPNGLHDVYKLLREARTDDHKVLIGLCGLAGLRIAEALAVTSGDFDLTYVGVDKVNLRVRGKGDKMRLVPISPQLWNVLAVPYLRACRHGGPLADLSDRAARSMVTRLGKRLSLEREISSHDLRMTFGTAVYAKTKDIELVRELLGHADTKTTQRYIEVSMTERHRAVAGLVV